jgi:hypothetical protein
MVPLNPDQSKQTVQYMYITKSVQYVPVSAHDLFLMGEPVDKGYKKGPIGRPIFRAHGLHTIPLNACIKMLHVF